VRRICPIRHARDGYSQGMPSQTPHTAQEQPRPDLREPPPSPPAEKRELDRGREKLERVLAK
jgi:hypothetical protein